MDGGIHCRGWVLPQFTHRHQRISETETREGDYIYYSIEAELTRARVCQICKYLIEGFVAFKRSCLVRMDGSIATEFGWSIYFESEGVAASGTI
jgi:hypothetical protein